MATFSSRQGSSGSPSRGCCISQSETNRSRCPIATGPNRLVMWQFISHCASCGQPVVPETPQAIWARLRSLPTGSRLVITFPLVAGLLEDEGNPAAIRHSLRRLGFDRLYHDGAVVDIDAWAFDPEDPPPDVVADRVVLRPERRKRIIDSLEMALRFGGGQLTVWPEDARRQDFSTRLSCARCGLDYNPPLPNLFSFNSPLGACDTCRGFGRTIGIDLPLKYLVWESTDGAVTIGWNDAAWTTQRHGIEDRAPVVQKMQGALRKFASEAAAP